MASDSAVLSCSLSVVSCELNSINDANNRRVHRRRLAPQRLARVTGTVVSTQKHRKLEGAKLLLVQPLTLEDTPRGPELLAVDGVGAGVHEKVLIVLEGRSASDAIGQKMAPVDAAIVGIVDRVDLS